MIRKLKAEGLLKVGVCRICGCTEDDPCYNPIHGYCWWADSTRTICSHCADSSIADDPHTVHCVNSDNCGAL